MKTTVLPERILRLMPKVERARLGKAGRTTEEIAAAVLHRQECDLQAQIAGWLRTRDIEYIKPDMRKRSPLPPGWPDFTFAHCGRAIGVECKVRGEALEPDQVAQHARMAVNGWRIITARTLRDVITLLREIEVTPA